MSDERPEGRPLAVVVLTHDPSRGCPGCYFTRLHGLQRRRTQHCHAVGGREVQGIRGRPAPDWCPLRSGRVVVERSET